MESILLVIHVVVAVLIVGLIMLQQGKGAEMGASFGAGSSQTVFGAGGSGNFFSRLTSIFVAVFFVTSFVLAMIAQKRVEVDDAPLPGLEKVVTEQELDQDADIPALEALSEEESLEDAASLELLDDDALPAEDAAPEVEAVEEDQ